MADQKIENLLNVSLSVDESEREKSPSLSIGYNQVQRTWEIIVRYTGNIEDILSSYDGIEVRPLLNNYAVIITPQQYVEAIANEPYVEFVEKPKRFFFELSNGKSQACINQVQQGANNIYKLYGEGVIVAIIDTGISAASPQFRNADGTTRILDIWDQGMGLEWNREQINEALANIPLNASLAQINRSGIIGQDVVGHGNDVAHIACGRDGVASQADIIVVKMGLAAENSFPRTTQLMEAMDYVIRKGVEYGKPVAINISFGNNYGDHTGSSLIETYMNDIAASWKCSICVGTGNEGLGATHSGGIMQDEEEVTIEFAIADYETSVNLQIWKDYWDEFDVEIITPSGQNLGKISRYNVVNQINVMGTTVLTYLGQPTPFSTRQEIYIDLIPQGQNSFIQSGVWKLRMIPGKIIYGRYDIWMPAIGSLNEGPGFLRPDSSLTLTVPSTASDVISVGAIDARTLTPAPFSGRGYVTQVAGYVTSKPDIVAPGVGISLRVGRSVSGTSFATPFVTGAAALLMEWGIVRGNDAFLYGEKLKAYLIKGAKPVGVGSRTANTGGVGIGGMRSDVPNPVTGWGALCVKDSLPI